MRAKPRGESTQGKIFITPKLLHIRITLDYIVEYLKNPMKTGVFNCQVTLDLSKIGKLYEYLLEHVKSRPVKTRIRRELRKIQKDEHYFSFKEAMDNFSHAVYDMLEMEKYPEQIEKLYDWQTKDVTEVGFEEPIPEIFSTTILSDLNDVLSIQILKPDEDETEDMVFQCKDLNEIALDITSVKKEGVTFFLKSLKTIPVIGKATVVGKNPTETHSSRYTFSPYALAVRLWLEKEASKFIPKDLRDFLTNSSKYYTSEEWRTSIVLSAIACESLLADLYEEEHREPTPSKATLGELFEYTEKKVSFPRNIAKAITMTNNARISAVHRSRFPVSDREAINALYGTINFAMWYFSRFQ